MEKYIQGLEQREVLCLERRYGNFIFGKIYLATSRHVRGTGANRHYADYQIEDEDGDSYSIDKELVQPNPRWKWVNP